MPKSRITQPPNKFEVQNAKINALIAYRKLHPKIRLAYESDIDVPIYWFYPNKSGNKTNVISDELSIIIA